MPEFSLIDLIFVRKAPECLVSPYAAGLSIQTHSNPHEETARSVFRRDQTSREQDLEENSLFQFQPPPRLGTHNTDSEAYFWVRNTVVHQPAVLLTVMETGLLFSHHWPYFIVYSEERPFEIRTFGFESQEPLNTHILRTRFRECYADQFGTHDTVSIGPVGLQQIQNRRTPISRSFRNETHADSGSLSRHGRSDNLYRAALLARRVSKSDVIQKADLEGICDDQSHQCLVSTEEGVPIGASLVPIVAWQRIVVTISKRDSPGASMICDCQTRPANMLETGASDDFSLMQTRPRVATEFDPILLYAFAGLDPFFGNAAEGRVEVETYCHLWVERDGPMRNHLPIVLHLNSPAISQVAARWTHHMQAERMRLVITCEAYPRLWEWS